MGASNEVFVLLSWRGKTNLLLCQLGAKYSDFLYQLISFLNTYSSRQRIGGMLCIPEEKSTLKDLQSTE